MSAINTSLRRAGVGGPSLQGFDVIVVGTGAGGASTARELALRGKRVLMLERGKAPADTGGLLGLAAMSDYVPLGKGIGMARALATGGTTAVYFGVAEFPALDSFRRLGVDLGNAVEEVRRELPLASPISDRLLSPQVLRVRDSATDLGLPWVKTESMLIEESKCTEGISHKAIWRARRYVDEAVSRGATLINRATVRRVVTEGSRAVGVEYELRRGRRRDVCRAYGRRIVLSAGAAATPRILRNSGLPHCSARGFYCDPGILVMGYVKDLKGTDLFPGSMGTNSDEDGILIGDGCLSARLFRAYMMAKGKFGKLLSHSRAVGVAVMVRDGVGGTLREGGGFHKEFTREELQKLGKGEALARRIVENSGARGIESSGISAAHLGGMLAIGEHVDADLQSECTHLHVCDCSVIPETIRLTPAVTLVCLGKYLAERLARTLS